MFYSHEVLTSRQYGVATVWLVATLGSKSSLKRINRKQILDVDVAKACQTIIDPVAPMALRLQGNLLYGVSRVYLQQCGYVLSDAQTAHNTMRSLLRTVANAALDPDAGKARPEQLVLPDDPSFLPEFALAPPELLADLDLDLVFNFDIAHTGESQSLTPFGSQESHSSYAGEVGGLILPTSSPVVPGQFRLEGDNGPGSIGEPSGMPGAGDTLEVLEPDFMFGDDGDIIELTAANAIARTPGAPAGAAMHSDAGASAKVRREHEEGRKADAQFPGDQMDIDFPVYGDDLPEGEEFSSAADPQSNEQSELPGSASTASAPMRRKGRTARVLLTDTAIELRNKELAEWNTNYLQNMKVATGAKVKNRAGYQAKKNAEHFVWGSGIGGVADQILGGKGANPFDMFIGDNLFELITGVSRKKVAGTKRGRDSGIDDATQEARRVRQKSGESEEQIGRGLEDEGLFIAGGDEVELPREGATALDDQQAFSAMPWNLSASIRGSSAIPRSGRVGMISSVDQGKRGSRMVSASPLLGRGQPGGLEGLKSLESDRDFAFGGDEFALPGPSSELPEPAAPVQTSMRVRDALSTEGDNFLTFVTEAISEKRTRAQANLESMSDFLQAEAAAEIDEITFEELLPPRQNNKVVACQGLMMVLALGMKGMLDIQQPEAFGEIGLKLTEKAKAMQVIEISDGEVSEDEEDSEEDRAQEEEKVQQDDIQEESLSEADEGHFQEQFAAGTAAQGDDDHDSLYND